MSCSCKPIIECPDPLDWHLSVGLAETVGDLNEPEPLESPVKSPEIKLRVKSNVIL